MSPSRWFGAALAIGWFGAGAGGGAAATGAVGAGGAAGGTPPYICMGVSGVGPVGAGRLRNFWKNGTGGGPVGVPGAGGGLPALPTISASGR